MSCPINETPHVHTVDIIFMRVALTLCERGTKKWLWSKHYSVAECLKVNAGNQKGNNWCDIHLVCVMHHKPWRQKKIKKSHKAQDPVKPLWWPYNQCQSENRKRGTFRFFFFFNLLGWSCQSQKPLIFVGTESRFVPDFTVGLMTHGNFHYPTAGFGDSSIASVRVKVFVFF